MKHYRLSTVIHAMAMYYLIMLVNIVESQYIFTYFIQFTDHREIK